MNNNQYFKKFQHQIDSGTLNHAYLLNGLASEQITTTINWILQYYYCTDLQKKEMGPCQRCRNCIAIAKHEFPGIIVINDAQQMIKIDQIREMTSDADYSDLNQKAKFFIIHHAELMNENSQNALLKHLENPAANCYFFLLTRNLYLLLPTIISRTEVVYFSGSINKNDLTDPKISEFTRLLLQKNPLAYVLLSTELKSLIKERGEAFFLYSLSNSYQKIEHSHEKARQLKLLNENFPQIRYKVDFQRLMEKFCLEVLSEDEI